ncbi:unnamed protein product [Urochloa humidicola]
MASPSVLRTGDLVWSRGEIPTMSTLEFHSHQISCSLTWKMTLACAFGWMDTDLALLVSILKTIYHLCCILQELGKLIDWLALTAMRAEIFA